MVNGLERARLVKKVREAGVTVQGTGTELLGVRERMGRDLGE